METNRVPKGSSILAQSSTMMWWHCVPAGSASARTPMWMDKKDGDFLYRFLRHMPCLCSVGPFWRTVAMLAQFLRHTAAQNGWVASF